MFFFMSFPVSPCSIIRSPEVFSPVQFLRNNFSTWVPLFHSFLIPLQITITASLGFDTFSVMRHGAGPFSTIKDLKTEALTHSPDIKEGLYLSGSDGAQRLGC